MKILYITGCLGFIGSAFTKRCLNLGWLVHGVDAETYAANIDLDDVRAKRMLGEISALKKRLWMIQINQTLSSSSFFFNLLTMFALYMGNQNLAKTIFGIALALLMLAVVLFIIEISIAVRSLNLHLSDLDTND